MPKLDTRLIVPYCITIAIVNLICTAVVALIVVTFTDSYSWKLFIESYTLGYILLWLANLKLIEEE